MLVVIVLSAEAYDYIVPDVEPVSKAQLAIRAMPVPFDTSDLGKRNLGPLPFLGAWHLTSTSDAFGGISALTVVDDRLLGLTDQGVLIGIGRPSDMRGQWVSPLPLKAGDAKMAREQWDSEAMVRDPVSGRYWVGFEMVNRICRYAPHFARLEQCRNWPKMKNWPSTESVEAMARMPDGSFFVFSEGASGAGGSLALLHFASDPVEPDTPAPAALNYVPPQGYRPTDALAIGPNRLLVLNRRATVLHGFTATLAVLDVTGARDGSTVTAHEIARLEPPVLADNFEALAIERRGGRDILWIASDDNHKFFQRTLLLAFLLPPELAPTPAE